ncbi:MAG TPA: restriction endonuclease subunit S [Draconibacterium sp.]|nr:restriction endonuclease subunit S [Draconibacterium sp.]
MEGWKDGTISSVATIGNGCDYKHLKEGDVPVFGTGGYMSSVSDFLYDGETVCIGRKGTIDVPMFHTGKIWTVDTLFYTHSFNNILPKYLFYVFQTINWKKYNEATGVPSLSKRTIEQIEISFPESEDEQREIVNILSTIDHNIEQTEQLITKYKNIKQGLMHDLLTFGVDENGNIRNPQTHAFVEKRGMLVPAEWEVFCIDELADLKSGGTPNRGESSFWNGGIPWVKTGEINYSIITDTEEYITEKGLNSSSAFLFPRGTILMALYGQGKTRGRVAILDIEAASNQACLGFLNIREVIASYLYLSLCYNYEKLRDLSNDGSQQNLSATLIKDFLLGIPLDEKEQDRITEILEQQDKLIDSEQTNLNKLQMLKQGLMQDLLTGKVRVNL